MTDATDAQQQPVATEDAGQEQSETPTLVIEMNPTLIAVLSRLRRLENKGKENAEIRGYTDWGEPLTDEQIAVMCMTYMLFSFGAHVPAALAFITARKAAQQQHELGDYLQKLRVKLDINS